MKKKLIIPIVILNLISCRSDSDNSDNSQKKIIGKWFYSKTVFVSGVNSSILSTENADSCEKKSFFDFTDDKVIESYHKIKNNNCVLDYSGVSLYRIENNILYYEDNASMKIESLSNSELVFLLDLYDINGDGQKDKILEYYYK